HHLATRFPALLLILYSTTLYGANRQIEEVVVTAEKREATVSDTSISITAFSTEMIEDLGIQGANELVNYIPATTRDAYDIRIRGVGRNFRALGGDPGVATYYNGVYSPDFGIAASENALYDLARVEVLRGPQGTLYGRNSIGGALNYVTHRPTFDLDAQARVQLGNFKTREFYGFVSGPLIDDVLAARLVGVKRDRDGATSNAAGDDVESVDDRNMSLALLWQPSETVTVNLRGNDRESDRDCGNRVFITEGAGPVRGTLASDQFVHGLRPVDAAHPQAIAFTNPVTGAAVYGAPRRPGVDETTWPFQPNATYGMPGLANLMSFDKEDPNNRVAVNHDPSCDDFPYTTCDSDHEYFGHRSSQAEIVWDISPSVSLTYIYGYTDFNYTFNQDLDDSPADFSKYRQTVEEDVYNYSHELQLNWSVGENFSATTGVYFFNEVRDQDYSLSNTTVRYTQAADYGALDTPVGFLGGSINDLLFAGSLEPGGGHTYLWSDEVGTSDYGRWEGDPRGDVYHHQNKVRNEATAIYTQGSYRFNPRWQLVLGVRYAKDDKAAREVRGGYSELGIPWADGFIGFIPGVGFQFPGVGGQTTLSVTNVAMGAATPSGDPSDPITPTCELTATDCATPLRLGGVPISFSSHVAGDDDWNDTNYRINVDWTPNDDILMYFSVTTGYRAGGYQLGVTDARDQQRDENGLPIAGANIIPLTYDKEEVRSIEVGYKGMHLDNTLQLNMSVYQYDYDNYQDRLNVFDPVRQQGVDIVQNANGVVNRGFEVEAMWLATDELTIGGNYSFTDTEYKDNYFVVINDDPALPQSLFGNPATNPELFVFNAKGDPLKRIPEHKATLWASYVMNTDFGSLTYRGTYSYTGEFYDEAYQTPRELVPDRFRTDLSVAWRDLSQRWTVRVFVDNATDERNLRGIGTASESMNWRMTGTVLYPRYYGIDVTYDLGGS
ncbi:MAG: TonB-dependent receptor, partial [Pseudomonadales bacterium]|nr:TonB-dependent receptor [Pseudomonadales bacterium]